MVDAVRGYIREAQEAELRGDKARAVKLLKQAAVIYRDAGAHSRALQLLRHARRVEGAPPEESGAPESSASEKTIDRHALSRGPAPADPAIDAWCSFCCRPRREIGELVAGPAGAFICRGCIGESGRLLGASLPVQSTAAIRPSHSMAVARQPELDELMTSLMAGARMVLLLGPTGSGKSELLKALAGDEGSYVTSVRGIDARVGRWMLDLDRRPSRAQTGRLLEKLSAHPGVQVVVAVRGEPPSPSLIVSSGKRTCSVHSSETLVSATGRRLPIEWAQVAQKVVFVPALSVEQLVELAHHRLQNAAEEPSAEALRSLAQVAHRSGRGAHEMVALLGRLPSGQWTVKERARVQKKRALRRS